MRYFLGVSFDKETKTHLSEIARMWDNFRLVHPDNYHMTLVFLGELVQEKLQLVELVAKNSADKFRGFEIKLDLLLTKRDMLWIVPSHAENTLLNLQKDLEKALQEQAATEMPNHDFRPHVKLGFTDQVGKREVAPVSMKVREFHLFKSMYEGRGTKYEILSTFKLGPST